MIFPTGLSTFVLQYLLKSSLLTGHTIQAIRQTVASRTNSSVWYSGIPESSTISSFFWKNNVIAPHWMKFGGGTEGSLHKQQNLCNRESERKTREDSASMSLLRLYCRASDKQFKTTVGSRKHFGYSELRNVRAARLPFQPSHLFVLSTAGHGAMSGTNFKKNQKSKTLYVVHYKLSCLKEWLSSMEGFDLDCCHIAKVSSSITTGCIFFSEIYSLWLLLALLLTYLCTKNLTLPLRNL